MESDCFLIDKIKVMKKIVLLCLVFLTISCQDSAIEKPSNLIEKDKMIDVLYDLSLLEAVKSQNIKGGISAEEINQYIFKKYKINKKQFVASNKYYASDVEEYKKMFDQIREKIDKENKKLTGKSLKSENNTQNSDTPTIY